MGDFLLVIIELFSLGAFVLSQYTRLTDGQTDRETDGQTESRQQYRVYASQSHGNKNLNYFGHLLRKPAQCTEKDVKGQ